MTRRPASPGPKRRQSASGGSRATAGLADPKKARDYYARAAKVDPENINGMFWHAFMEQNAGNLGEAEWAYTAVAAQGIKVSNDFELCWARLGLGDIKSARGNLPEALKTYRAAAADAERLAAADPGNAGWQGDLAASHGKLGQLLKAMGQRDEALDMFRKGRAIVAPFAEKSGHQLWIGYLKRFDADIAALEK